MKKLIVFCLLVLSFSVYAGKENCPDIGELAEVIMDHRQSGTDMQKLYVLITVPITEHIIIDAYSKPMFQTEEYRERAVSQFKNKWFLLCIKANKE